MFVSKGSSVLAPLILTLSVVLLSRKCIIRFSSSVTRFVNNCSSCECVCERSAKSLAKSRSTRLVNKFYRIPLFLSCVVCLIT